MLHLRRGGGVLIFWEAAPFGGGVSFWGILTVTPSLQRGQNLPQRPLQAPVGPQRSQVWFGAPHGVGGEWEGGEGGGPIRVPSAPD